MISLDISHSGAVIERMSDISFFIAFLIRSMRCNVIQGLERELRFMYFPLVPDDILRSFLVQRLMSSKSNYDCQRSLPLPRMSCSITGFGMTSR